MRRVATGKVKLSDGLVVPKGSRLVVTNESMRSDGMWENGEQFDPYRFMLMREDLREEHLAHLVSTSPNHFGHGNHACPGRFFAANELKILLCHLLLKYEWKLAPGTPKGSVMFGFATPCNPKAKISIRHRPEQWWSSRSDLLSFRSAAGVGIEMLCRSESTTILENESISKSYQ